MTFPIGRTSTAESDVRVGEAWSQFNAGKVDNAIQMFREAVKTWSDHVDAHYGLGLSLKAAKQLDEAATEFNTAKTLVAAELLKPQDETPRYQMLKRMIDQQLVSLNTMNSSR